MEKAANSLDATLLFASLLEATSINPALVLVPGHAFVGWETGQGNDEWAYLETSIIGLHAFDEAMSVAKMMVERYQTLAQGSSDSTIFRRLSLRDLRTDGIMPLQ